MPKTTPPGDTHPTPLGQRLLQAIFPHPIDDPTLLETHISWVVLTGRWAYKLKKPVRFEFLDYSTLELRRHFCQRELEVNRVWAPQIYHGVVPIFERTRPLRAGQLRVGQPDERAGSDERLVDHAVQMRQFDQSALLAEQLAAGAIPPVKMEQLACDLAQLHQRLDAVANGPELVDRGAIAPAQENLDYLQGRLAGDDRDRDRLDRVAAWTQRAIPNLLPPMQRRAAAGRVRNCHGDLHLNNLLYLDGRFVPFDGIEFNDALRQIDVLSELAFLVMELHEHDYHHHAHRLVNRYIEATDDYQGLEVLPYHLVYRALVRAKVDSLRQQQAAGDSPADPLSASGRQYLAYADRVIQRPRPQLWITHGLSGSGKSVSSAMVVQQDGFIRIRSDVVRKRLAGIDPFAASAESPPPSLYSAEMTHRTYQHLLELAQQVIDAGFCVIIDAAMLQHQQRNPFRDLARQRGVTYRIVHCHAPPQELQRRILARCDDPSDATIEILNHQLRTTEPLREDELKAVIDQQQIPR